MIVYEVRVNRALTMVADVRVFSNTLEVLDSIGPYLEGLAQGESLEIKNSQWARSDYEALKYFEEYSGSQGLRFIEPLPKQARTHTGK